MPAVAMTDHGNMFGAYEFQKTVAAAGLTPIIGIEAYVAPESRFHREPVYWGEQHQRKTDEATGRGGDISASGSYLHKTLLAASAQGLRNLFKISSLASLEGHYRKWPRMDDELLEQYHEGIIATTGCPSGRGPDPAAARPVRRGAEDRREVPGHLRQGELLPGADGPRHPDRDRGPRRPAAHRQAPEHPAPGHQRLALRHRGPEERPRRAAVRGHQLPGGRPDPVPVLRRGLLPAHRRRDARPGLLRRVGRGVPEHAPDRRAGRVLRGSVRPPGPGRQVPRPGRGNRDELAAQGSGQGRGRPLRRPGPGGGDRADRVRAGRHRADGVPRLLPRGRRHLPVRPGERHRARAGPRVGDRQHGRLRHRDHRAGPDRALRCCSSGSSTPSASACPTSTWTSTSAAAAT